MGRVELVRSTQGFRGPAERRCGVARKPYPLVEAVRRGIMLQDLMFLLLVGLATIGALYLSVPAEDESQRKGK